MDAQSQWTGLDAGRLERITDHLERNYIGPGKIAGGQAFVEGLGLPVGQAVRVDVHRQETACRPGRGGRRSGAGRRPR